MKASSASMSRPNGAEDAGLLDVERVHAAHADFVFRSLARLGVRDADLPDMLQEVFVVVHRRAASYDGKSKLTSWLFGICLRVAAGYRRKRERRREQALPDGLELASGEEQGPEQACEAARARAELAAILDAMPLEKRAVFVMFEIDAMSCAEIAHTLDVPIGTVHSRLHAARHAFELALQKRRAQRRAAP